MENTPPPGTPGKPTLNVNLSELPYLECEAEGCGSKVFTEAMMIKKVSKFMTGNKEDSIAPIPVLACAKCGHVNELFLPKL